MPTESEVQLQLDGTGKKVRTLEITSLLPDGTTPTVEMQVISIADPDGTLVYLSSSSSLLNQILEELRKANNLQTIAIRQAAAIAAGGSYPDELP